MKTLELVQGSAEWLAARAQHFTASEAPIMMGVSKHATRNDLLRMKATGDEKEISRWTEEVLFANGHAVEEAARPIAERIIGEQLFPTTATDDAGELLASFDGITMTDDVVWENKQWNEAKAESLCHGEIPPEDYWQCVQQLVVSRAEKLLYMVSDGTEEKTVCCWMMLNPSDEKALRAGWKQFAEDLANYQPPEEADAVFVGRAPENLPALRIEVRGEVTASNIGEFREHALSVFKGINRDLQTDEHFADAEKVVKWCGEVEKRIEAAKQHALAQTQSIDELFRTLDSVSAEARTVRLELDKLVKARKEAIRGEILTNGNEDYQEHIAKLNESLGKALLSTSYGTVPKADFAGVMKGKKTVKSLRDAVDQELARVKIASNDIAERVRANLKKLEELIGDGPRHLIHDWRELVFKDAEAMEAIVKNRVSEHKAEEERKLEAERERIRQEEADRLRREQEEAERKQQAEEAAKAAQAAEPPQTEAITAPQPVAAPAPPTNKPVTPPGPTTADGVPKAYGVGRSAPANSNQPRTLQADLEDWRRKFGIQPLEFGELLAILNQHNVRGAA